HVWIRALRKPPVPILEKSAERVGIRLLEPCAQRHGVASPALCFPERAMTARKREQGEGLIVEIERCVADLAIKVNYGNDRCVGSDEVLSEIIECVALGLAPGATPAKPASFPIGERLAGDHPGAMRQWQRPSVKADCFVKSAPNAICTLLPP